jgi:hypothetical protein
MIEVDVGDELATGWMFRETITTSAISTTTITKGTSQRRVL